jgi:hypothetical protein
VWPLNKDDSLGVVAFRLRGAPTGVTWFNEAVGRHNATIRKQVVPRAGTPERLVQVEFTGDNSDYIADFYVHGVVDTGGMDV